MTAFLIGLFLGMFIGYVICDLLTKESSIVFHIKKLRAKKGGTVSVDTEVIVEEGKKEKRTKEQRKADRKAKRDG